jgi:hypothetical protein
MRPQVPRWLGLLIVGLFALGAVIQATREAKPGAYVIAAVLIALGIYYATATRKQPPP